MTPKAAKAENVIADLFLNAQPVKAKVLQRFFKTGKGQYGEGDVFLGITVPEQRRIASHYRNLSFSSIKKLLQSPIHEHRLTALLILVDQFEKASEKERKKIFDFTCANRRFVNNWDLVDLSAPKIVGAYLCKDRSCMLLKKLARAKHMWDRRIAIVATYALIRNNRFDITIALARELLNDKNDLIHKAVGWMLREVGKRDEETLKDFLDTHAPHMPRTMLRYAIERLPAETRVAYMTQKIRH